MAQAALKKPPSAMDIVKTVREAMHLFFGQEPNAITRCERVGEHWQVGVEFIESKAKLDNNDLISFYEVTLDADGEVQGYTFRSRYFRMDRAETKG